MAAKKAAKKAPAKKKAKKSSSEVVPFTKPRSNGRPVEDVVDEQLAKVELWRQAWELRKAGVSFPKIGETFGYTDVTARNYYLRYQKYRGASPKIEAEREHELAGLLALEERLWGEGVRGDASWAVVSREIRGLYADRRDILGFDQAEPAASGPIGVVGDDGSVTMPAAIAAILEG